MKILITGARGFIGSHLGNKLVELGHDVYGVDNDRSPSENEIHFPCIKGHFLDVPALFGADAVIHLAALINVDESIVIPQMYFRNNAHATLDLLEHVRHANPACKFIFASSAEVYGNAKYAFMDEDHPLDPLSPYAVSKLAAEQMCKVYSQLFGIDITIIRNFNTFGPYQHDGPYGGVIAKFKTQAQYGDDLTVYGDGEQMRDYMHIDQAVNGYLLALEKKLPLIVNFGSGSPIKIIDISKHIASKFGVGIVHADPRPNEIILLRAEVSLAESYGYKVETDFWKHLDEYLDHGTA